MDLHGQLQSIPQFSYPPLEVKQLFVNGIAHSDYAHIKDVLADQIHTVELPVLAAKLRQKQFDLKNGSDSASSSKRRVIPEPDADKQQDKQRHVTTGTLPPLLNPNLAGIIKIGPYAIWAALKQDHKDFILKYNTATRHKEPHPAPPSGITVGEQKDDGNKNEDLKIPSKSYRSRRTRRRRAADYFNGPPPDTTDIIESYPRRITDKDDKLAHGVSPATLAIGEDNTIDTAHGASPAVPTNTNAERETSTPTERESSKQNKKTTEDNISDNKSL